MLENGHTRRTNSTRSRLLTSAIALLREGSKPSIEEVGRAAGVSRRTAHRYFASREHMLAEAALEAVQERIDHVVQAALSAPTARERLVGLASALNRTSFEHEAELRTIIRLSMDTDYREHAGPDSRLRSERRVDWVETALTPARDLIAAKDYEHLVSALVVSIGVDAATLLTDLRHLSPDQVEQTTVWTVTALLDRAIAGEAGVAPVT